MLLSLRARILNVRCVFVAAGPRLVTACDIIVLAWAELTRTLLTRFSPTGSLTASSVD